MPQLSPKSQMMSELDCSWAYPPGDLVLNDDEVHVWCASLNQTASGIDRLAHSLSLEECKRAERFYFPKDRLRFIVRRGLLRTILGYYSGIEPSRVQLCYGSNGKPALEKISSAAAFRFNMSRSGDLALYAVTRYVEIGVDLEGVGRLPDAEQIVERFFSPAERATFHSLPSDQKLHAFFNCWTRKEAYLKALGDGLSRSLDDFDVSLAPGEPARLLRVKGNPHEVSRWSLCELNPAKGYAAALAVEGHGWSLACWQWIE